MAFTLQIGRKAPDFNLPGADGRRYAPASFKDAHWMPPEACGQESQ
jgi:peroxiredoxin